jgi:glycosyltransferase involved in cell wall biosynthesis
MTHFIKLEKLTIIILTLNEEDFIEGAIEASSFADEIIVIDSYSTDKTPELVKKYNVVFIQHLFENFSNQRYFAAKHATNNMILFVDADERIPNLLKEEIQNVLKKDELNSGYEIFISGFFMGRRMKHGGFQNNWKLRLFNKRLCWYDESLLVHEKIIVKEGKTVRLKHSMDHYTFRSWNHYIKKKQLYAELQSQELHNKGIKPNAFHFIIKPIYRFLNHYIFRGGFLDGFPGFAVAFGNAYVVATRYIKLWLLCHNMK